MINTSIKITFFLLVLIFVLIVLGMFVSGVSEKLFEIAGPLIVFAEWGVFFILGAVLIILTLKNRVEPPLKKFLLLTAISAVGFFVFVVLHNLVSGLLSTIFNKEIEEPLFFILATIVCPLGFLIGATRSAIIFIKP